MAWIRIWHSEHFFNRTVLVRSHPQRLAGLAAFFADDERRASRQTRITDRRADTRARGQIPIETVDSVAQSEGLTPRQRSVMGALLGQESNNGANAVTSIDGARGAGQIMPGTFKMYAKPGEDINNTEHNLAVMARIVKDLGATTGDDPAKIAVGYFSGAGNINKGDGAAWRRDAADGNGKRVSSYVSDILRRVGDIAASPAQAAEQPTTGRARHYQGTEVGGYHCQT